MSRMRGEIIVGFLFGFVFCIGVGGAVEGRLGSSLCDNCIQTIGIAKRLFMDKEAETEVAQMFKGLICPALSYLQSICNLWIDNYVPEMMYDLANKTDPRKFCIDSQFCPPQRWIQETTEGSLLGPGRGRKSRVAMATKLRNRVGESLCGYCLEFLAAMKRTLTDRQSAADIAKACKGSCSILTNLTTPCEHWMVDHMPDALWLLGSEIDPMTWCLNATICKPTEASANSLPSPASVHIVLNPKASDGLCEFCHIAVTEAKQMLSDGKTRDAILKFIKDQLCTIVPEDKDKCDHAVDTYGPIIIQLLMSELDPVSVCQLLGFCPKSAAVTAHREIVRDFIRRDGICEFCHSAVTEAKQMLSDGKTRDAIFKYIKDQVCAIVPEDKDKCDHAVDTYGPIIIQLLMSELDPVSVCEMLGLCPKSTAARGRFGDSKSTAAGPTCQLCQIGVSFIQAKVRTDNATRAKLLANLESVCFFLPAPNRTACHDFAQRYGIQVVLDVNPYRYCQALSVCPKPAANNEADAASFDARPLRYHGNGEPAALIDRAAKEEPLL